MQEAGISVTLGPQKVEPKELIAECRQHDALLNSGYTQLNAEFLQACKNLKVIALFSVGFDHVDIAEATRLKIPVGNTPNVLSNATADTAFLLMLASSRKAFYLHKKIIKGEWGAFEATADLGIELYEKTLGVWGLGRIGFEMAKRCVGAYGMQVIYCNRNSHLEAEKILHAKKVSFEELLAQSDVLSVHTALTPETSGKFDKSAFKQMKKTSIFINAARGAIHNEKDLIEALQNGTIWGAGLDVTNPEPMHPDNPLLNMPSVAVLPHVGSATEETRESMAKMAAENIISGLKGARLPFIVNPDAYLIPT